MAEEEPSKLLKDVAPSKQEEAEACGPSAPAEFATANKGRGDDAQGNKIVITEMEEFVLGLQLNQEKRKLEALDVFAEEADNVTSSDTLAKDGMGGLAVIGEQAKTEDAMKDGEEGPVKPDEVLHEVAVGKGLAGALQFLKDRGTLNEGGNRTTGKKKRLVVFKDEPKEIRIERTDEFGRAMTPKEAFRDLSHRFHGKHPGKTKQEKRQRKYQDELKTKRMKSSDTPLMSAEKMREAQVRSKTPYLVLSGNASNPRGYDSDSPSGSAETASWENIFRTCPVWKEKEEGLP